MKEEIVIEIKQDEELIIDDNGSQVTIEPEESHIVKVLYKNYENLNNKPKIEGVELVNNKTFKELGAKSLTNLEIEKLLNLQV